MADRIFIELNRYEWAIKRAGFTVDDYVNRHPKTRVLDWMEGKNRPTIKQLEDFARTVSLPLGFLFLKELPQEKIPIPMFRGSAGNGGFNLNVYDTIMQVVQRQNWLEDYLKENAIETCTFVNSMSIKDSVQLVVAKLRDILALDERWALSLATVDAAVNKLTEKLEDAGVFVVYNSVVGNNTRRHISVEDCRGFALVNTYAPYVFVNNSDSKNAQMFTLIHETVHLIIGASAGYAGDIGYEHDVTEAFCDKVAAEFLVPTRLLAEQWDCNITKLSKKFKVSELVIARRAHNTGLLSDEEYRNFYLRYKSNNVIRKKTAGGSFYLTSVKRVGRLFAIHVRNAVNNRQLSYTEAYRLTGLYGNTYNQFMTNNI